MRLVLVSYAMDSSSLVFAHQVDLVRKLSSEFDEIIVFTRGKVNATLPSNVLVRTFLSRHYFSTIFFTFWCNYQVLLLLKARRKFVVFSHMNETASAALGPLLRMFRVRHVLWYAHGATPLRLRIALRFVNAIVTSTPGSFRLKSWKVNVVGQAINNLRYVNLPEFRVRECINWCHIGRIDPSKNIDLLLDFLARKVKENNKTRLTLYGQPSKDIYFEYLSDLKFRYQDLIDNQNLFFVGKLDHDKVAQTLHNHDLFVHAYIGSLDKSLLEATLSGVPVLTLNQEYLNEFGSWSESENITLDLELDALQLKSQALVNNELQRRKNIVESAHSLDSWIDKVKPILLG